MRRTTALALIVVSAGTAFAAGRLTAQPRKELPARPAGTSTAPGSPSPARVPDKPAVPVAAPPADVASPLEMRGSVAPLVDRVKASVVTIQSAKLIRRVQMDDPWGLFPRPRRGDGEARSDPRDRVENLGSGFILDREGIILTNNHVVAGADEVMVRLIDDRRFSAKVMGSDPATDVAVVKIEKPPHDLTPAPLGDSDRLRVGDYVLAIGNPLGLGQTVTMGIVSAKNRVLQEELGDYDRRYMDFIQTDAAINQGNSGGPLFNFGGEVVGINSVIIRPGVAMNVGFAIPINLARSIGDQLRKSGRVARGYLGVANHDFTAEHAQQLGVPFVPGAIINQVPDGTPAAKAGLRPNDVIVEVDGRPIENQRSLAQTVASRLPGQRVKVVYLRDGQRFETTAELAAAALAGEPIFFGVKARPLLASESQVRGLPPGAGLAVTSVDPRGPASGHIEEGDVIIEVNGRPVTMGAAKAVEQVLGRHGRARITVQRANHVFHLMLNG